MATGQEQTIATKQWLQVEATRSGVAVGVALPSSVGRLLYGWACGGCVARSVADGSIAIAR